MRNFRLLPASIFLITASFLLMGWGYTGHNNIAAHMNLSFNDAMQPFNEWVNYITEHSSDADYRKSDDPNEGVRHYIDIDNYAEFVSNGEISQSLDEMIAQHGSNVVYDNGVLPWATLNSYDSLVANLKRYNWEQAKYYAADLSHYVADGHMPMHITKNYDGQLTNNKGIHSRYESTMINDHIQEIQFTGQSIQKVDDVSQYIFNYLYTNYKYVDSVLEADDYAKTFSTYTSSTEYKDALWDKSKNFTQLIMNNASHALAELLYNAWLEAGSPDISGNGIQQSSGEVIPFEIAPNPFHGETTLNFNLSSEQTLSIQIYDLLGNQIQTILSDNLAPSNYKLTWDASSYPDGVYLVKLATPDRLITRKVILSR